MRRQYCKDKFSLKINEFNVSQQKYQNIEETPTCPLQDNLSIRNHDSKLIKW